MTHPVLGRGQPANIGADVASTAQLVGQVEHIPAPLVAHAYAGCVILVDFVHCRPRVVGKATAQWNYGFVADHQVFQAETAREGVVALIVTHALKCQGVPGIVRIEPPAVIVLVLRPLRPCHIG